MKLRYLAPVLMIASLASAAGAEVLVVRASGPSAKAYPAGKAIPDNARITLKANDSLVLLDARGTRTLRGPGTFTPSGPAQAAQGSVLASAATAGSSRRARIGAVRKPMQAGTARSPSIWHVDVARSSNICLADPTNVTLWRGDASKAAPLTVTRPGDGATRQLNWAKGQTTLGWPADLAIQDGSDYRLSWPGAAQPTSLKFRTLPAKPGGLEEMASSLIQNGCEAQLDVLIETVKLPDDQSAPSG